MPEARADDLRDGAAERLVAHEPAEGVRVLVRRADALDERRVGGLEGEAPDPVLHHRIHARQTVSGGRRRATHTRNPAEASVRARIPRARRAEWLEKAGILTEALPYMRRYAGKTFVIKYGGHAMGNPKLAKSFARDIGLMKEVGIYPIVVHGGGPQIADKLKTKNIATRFIDGLRVTDIETVKVVEDVLGNEINAEIVKAISDSGGKAVGLTGNKNNLLNATKLKMHDKQNMNALYIKLAQHKS